MPDKLKHERPASSAKALDYGCVRLPVRGKVFQRSFVFRTLARLSCTSLAVVGSDEFLGTHFLDGFEPDQEEIVCEVYADDEARKFGVLVVSMSLDDPRLQQLRRTVTECARGREPDVVSIPAIPNKDGLLGGLGQLVCHGGVSGGEYRYHFEVTGTDYQRTGTAEQLAYAEPIVAMYAIQRPQP